MTPGPGSATSARWVQTRDPVGDRRRLQQLLATLSSLDRDLVSDRIAELRENLAASTEQLEPVEVPAGAEAAGAPVRSVP